MCYGKPDKSLALAYETAPLEFISQFEDEFAHFCAYSGLTEQELGLYEGMCKAWAKWAFWKAKTGSLGFEKQEKIDSV